MALPCPRPAPGAHRARLVILIGMAGCERRRAAVMPRGSDRADTIGWSRDFIACARRARLNHEA